ncbi:MAG: hypothetical protein A2Z62_01815 [Candidatus Terrybacteria bacterium RIFCSPLOWO2_02_42_20]|uniref:Ribosomal RNA small subunit methyltransferase A n=1 Tax=Candidatus Terrybacteria bacterium RIFCSPLOWO2_02_42_20 TaxID=1802370 RepID=A0A1G2Q0U8_9BACT|nr:MAG: hypothetical protein A2Z62_01815 [Candidatus Terrybacteria bacterium RIFCSPLOWO2_02_42_20]
MSKPKKALGQNFLKSEKIAQEIAEAGEVGFDDIVLEVGPGKGILTEKLLEKAKKVIAVEKDEELVYFLSQKFSEEIKNEKLELISGDILQSQISNLKSKKFKYKLIANIPYYITSHLLRTFLESDYQPSLMVLMVQKEVAERIVGAKRKAKRNFSRFTLPRSGAGSDASQNFVLPSSKESLLSISVKAYGRPEIIRYAPAGYFSPAPKIDSAVIKISGISKKFFQDIGEQKFFETVKKGFSQKRKMLINNLKVKKDDFTACNIDEKARAENLSLEQWKCLTVNVKVSP